MWKEVVRIVPVVFTLGFASVLAIFFAASDAMSAAASCSLTALLSVTMLSVITSQNWRILELERELRRFKQQPEE